MEQKGTKTLRWSVIMSAPGPLILGIGLLLGRSNTQLADFIRRTIELLAIIASFAAYRITIKKQLNDEQKVRLEKQCNLFVGVTMTVAGLLMLGITLFSENRDKGNVSLGLVIAFLGVVANTIFWFRYRKLAKSEKSAILEVQSRLYRAKSFVDGCVTIALFAVMIAPLSLISYYLDFIGSAIVSVYLGYSGMKIVVEKMTEGTGIKGED